MPSPTHHTVLTPARLDTFVSQALDTSRNQTNALIEKGFVAVDGATVNKLGLKLKIGQEVTITLPSAPSPSSTPPQVDFDVEILYEDEAILVINKPPHLTVHEAPSVKEPTLVDWLKAQNISLSTIAGEERHGIVHRLDKGTSGVMVVAKTNEAHENLSQQLQEKSMGRYYLALIDIPLKSNTIVDKPIARNPQNRLKMGIVPEGRNAKTAFAKLATSRTGAELIACKLFTGRTHQIRVHLASISRHIAGDTLYGIKSKGDKINRIFLHAFLLYLRHPVSGQNMQFKATLPDDLMQQLLSQFESEQIDEILDSSLERYFDDMDSWVQQTHPTPSVHHR